jgi:hypothetical protein
VISKIYFVGESIENITIDTIGKLDVEKIFDVFTRCRNTDEKLI